MHGVVLESCIVYPFCNLKKTAVTIAVKDSGNDRKNRFLWFIPKLTIIISLLDLLNVRSVMCSLGRSRRPIFPDILKTYSTKGLNCLITSLTCHWNETLSTTMPYLLGEKSHC